MKKFFSFFAALLFAGSMMAEEATMTAGTNGSECTVNDVAGIKCGTSKAGGDMTITVGAGATKLSFYAAAWKGVTGLSLNLAADGVTFSPASVSLTADDGISNNTPFTLSGLPENFKFEVELTGVTAETTIAVTSSAAKRFVVWGASYEAGEAPAVATPVISGEAEFTESTQVTITCATEGAAIYYTLDGADPTTNSLPYDDPFTLNETATVKAVALLGSDLSTVAEKTFTKVEPLADPTNCAEAATAALSVSANNVLYNNGAVYTIQGYVTSIKTAYSDQYHNISFWMADTQEGGEVLQAYRAACASEEEAPQVGDKVAVTGSLTKYGTTPEFAQGCTYVIMDAPVVDNIWTVAGSPSVFGSEWSASDANNDMVKQEDGTYKWEKENLLLEAGNVEFKVVKDHSWAEGYPEQNYQLNIAEAAIYTITIIFNEETKAITANALKTGDAPVVDEWAEIVFTEAVAADDIAEDASFTVEGSEFAATITDPDNKMSIDANTARFGTVEAFKDYTHRLKTGGKSSSTKNFITLNIPEDGQLRIAVRTGSNSATDRNLVIAQGVDTLYNQVVKEEDKTVVPGEESSTNYYPYIIVDVNAGSVVLSYPTNGLNFYAFAFKAGEVVPPTPEHTYTVAGGSDVLFGTTWAPANTANDMALVEGLYTWEKSELTLAAGNIQFKVCEDHGWDVAYPAQNYELAIAEAGIYTITITFNAETKEVNAVATKTGEAVVVPTVAMHGNFLGSWADTENFAIAQDNASASLTLTLAEGNYEFGMRIGGSGNWTANGANLTREANTTNLAEGSGNMHIAADVAGDYVFTYTYETQVLEVVYPEAPVEGDTIELVFNNGGVDNYYYEQYGSTDIQLYNIPVVGGQLQGDGDFIQLEVYPADPNDISGEYSFENEGLDDYYTYLMHIEGTDTTEIEFVDGSITVSVQNADKETYSADLTVQGQLKTAEGDVYVINTTLNVYYNFLLTEEEKYQNDEEEAEFNYNFDSYQLGALNEVVVGVMAQTDQAGIALAIILPEGQTELTAGTYEISVTPMYGTVMAGQNTETGISPSYAMTADKKLWFLVSGTVTVNEDGSIVVDALNSNNKAIKSTLNHLQGQGIEDVNAAKKAIKRLVNGQLVIEKAGKTYNATGAVVR